MNILVVGSGAREHTIVWKLQGSPRVDAIFVVPGNAGTGSIATNLPGSISGLEGIVSLVESHGIGLTIVGPEVPLAEGIVDLFRKRGFPVFGPTRAAARIEASKAFAKELMSLQNIPCPDFKVCGSYGEAAGFLSNHTGPVVVKADGLAAGKGVLVCMDKEEALKAVHDCMEARAYGTAGETVVLEQYLVGPEVSVFAFCDGEHLSALVAACDYKRLLDGDGGPNTGGMGSYSPPEFWTPRLEAQVREGIMAPMVKALSLEGTPYQGVLYAGLMVTSDGPKVLEFNCRFGDPETQVILPLLETDLVDVALASIEGRLDSLPVVWKQDACVGVVMASEGYPGDYHTGHPIGGLDLVDADALVFQSGTRRVDDGPTSHILTDGGRVLTLVGRGPDLAQARAKVYDNIGKIKFPGAHYRGDIGLIKEIAAL